MPSPSQKSFRRWLLLPVILIALAAALWFGSVRDNLYPRNFGEVDPGKVYRSASLTPAATRRAVEQNHIRTIIDLGGFDKDPAGEIVAQRTADALGVTRFVFPLEGDGTGNPNAYVAALRIMTDPTRQPVLVHCSAGAQRTSGAVMLYRHIVQHKPFLDTYPECFNFGHDPDDNTRLMPYLADWNHKITLAFESGTMIPGEPVVPLLPAVPPPAP